MNNQFQTFNFDSINSQYSNLDPFDTRFQFNEPIKNIKRIMSCRRRKGRSASSV